MEGEWIEGDDAIVEAACTHFQNIFTGEVKKIDEEAFNCIPTSII